MIVPVLLSPEGSVVEVLAPEEEGWTLGIALACAPDGGFALAWQTGRSPAEAGTDIVLQRFDTAGERIGEPFRVNALTVGNQTSPALALVGERGRFVVVWREGRTYSARIFRP